MTVSKLLATGKRGHETYHAYESYDKYSAVPYYEIVVSDDNGIALSVIKTAKTTWRKKFRELTK